MSELWQSNQRLAADQFGDEIVLINIEKGIYFSLRGAALELWNALGTPRHLDGLVSAFGTGIETRELSLIETALNEMKRYELILSVSGTAIEEDTSPLVLQYSAPSVEAFTDLAELIIIDPVHEVDVEQGWPLRPPGFPELK